MLDVRVARAQQAEEVHYLDKTRAIGSRKACAAVAVACVVSWLPVVVVSVILSWQTEREDELNAN